MIDGPYPSPEPWETLLRANGTTASDGFITEGCVVTGTAEPVADTAELSTFTVGSSLTRFVVRKLFRDLILWDSKLLQPLRQLL